MINASWQNEQIPSFYFDANPAVIFGVSHVKEAGPAKYEANFFVGMQMLQEENLQLNCLVYYFSKDNIFFLLRGGGA